MHHASDVIPIVVSGETYGLMPRQVENAATFVETQRTRPNPTQPMLALTHLHALQQPRPRWPHDASRGATLEDALAVRRWKHWWRGAMLAARMCATTWLTTTAATNATSLASHG